MGVKEVSEVQAFEEPEKPSRQAPPWVKLANYVADSVRFYQAKPLAFARELLSGFLISLVQVPESVAFSLIAGVHPKQGLYGSFWLGLTTALLGGRPGAISGCAAAFAVAIREVMRDSGPFGNKCPEERREYLLFVMFLTGLLQLLCAILQFARAMKLVPKTASLGFFNGLALLIFITQVEVFKKTPAAGAAGVSGNCRAVDFGFRPQTEWYGLHEDTAWLMITEVAIVLFFMGGLYLLPKIQMGSFGKVSLTSIVPPSIVGMLLAVAYEWLCVRSNDWSTPVVKDISQMDGALSPWHVPDVPWDQWETWSKSFPIAICLCFIGLVESMLTLQAVDEALDQRSCTFQKTQECIAQGLGNILSGFFMGLGGDATMSQTTANIATGAQGRLSSFVAALCLLLWTGVLGSFIEGMPIAALAGVLFVIVIQTFKWSSLAIIFRRAIPLHMSATIVLVTVVSALTNLAIGIAVGIVWESLAFVWTEGSRLGVTRFEGESIKTYRVEGSLFYANADALNNECTPQDDPRNIVVDLANSRALDVGALHALNVLGKRYKSANKRLLIRMREEDYKTYADICDEKAMAQDRPLRRHLKTHSVKSLHGRVVESPLLPTRYQEFERLAHRAHSATNSKPNTLDGHGPRLAAGSVEPAASAPQADLPLKAQAAVAHEDGSVQEGGDAQVPLILVSGGDVCEQEGAPSPDTAAPSPPPSEQAAVLLTQVHSPSPGTPNSAKGGAKGSQPGAPAHVVALPGVPQEPADAVVASGVEETESWVSEESV